MLRRDGVLVPPSVYLPVLLGTAATLCSAVLFRLWRASRQQQRELQLRLLASETRYHQFTLAADLCLAVLDDEGRVADWNPALEKLFRCPADAAIGQPFFRRFAPPFEAAGLLARVEALRGSDDHFEFDFTVPQEADLAPCQLRWRARHFTDPRDGRRCLSLIGHDITALEFVLAQLADSEGRFRHMFESVPVALALFDLEGRLRMANGECAGFFGFDAPEQMVALNIQELIEHADDRAATTLALTALRARSESHYRLEARYRRRDGEARWGNARMALVEVAPGQSFFLVQLSDVHERKQTEQALLESERRLATLIANLSGAVYRYELPAGGQSLHHDCMPEFLSDDVENLTGLPRQHFMPAAAGQGLGRLIVAEDRELLQQALARAMAGDGRFAVSYRLRHAGGGLRWISEHGLAWQRPDGSWTVDGHLTDISSERQAREAEQVYRTLVADTHTGYVSLNAAGLVLEVNEPFCRLFGLSAPDRVMGRVLQPLLAPGYDAEIEAFLQRALAEGSVRDLEFSYRRGDGQRLHFLLNAIAVREGEQPAVKCLLVDISRIRRAERARRESEARYRRLFDTNLNGVCFLTLEGGIEAANPALCRLLGRGEEELRWKHLQEFTPAAWQQEDLHAHEQILLRGFCAPYRKTLRRDDGSETPVSVQAWLVRDEYEQPQQILCMVSDIGDLARMESEREELQKGLRQAQKMEAVGQLAGGIAHDFNNILASILGYAEMAEKRLLLPGEDRKRVPAYLKEIQAAGLRARELIRQLLLFSRAGRPQADVQELPHLVQGTVRMLRPTLPAGLRLRSQVSHSLPPVRVDAVGLQQVVMNLVINARDASGEQGEVRVLARMAEGQGLRCASCHAVLEGHWVEVAVGDQGEGIAPEVRERIFDPFFTTKPQGTGMGLSVVHGVVHESQGHVVVESDGSGSLFRVLLPAACEPTTTEPLPVDAPDIEAGKGQRILVVDDDAAVAAMLGELLRLAGYEPLVVDDSTAAAMLLEDVAMALDALIADQVMPGFEGGELAQLARRYRPTLPVILLSARVSQAAQGEARETLLPKPVASRDLLLCLQRLLQTRWHDEAAVRRSGNFLPE